MVPLDVEHARQRLGETNYDETGALDDGGDSTAFARFADEAEAYEIVLEPGDLLCVSSPPPLSTPPRARNPPGPSSESRRIAPFPSPPPPPLQLRYIPPYWFHRVESLSLSVSLSVVSPSEEELRLAEGYWSSPPLGAKAKDARPGATPRVVAAQVGLRRGGGAFSRGEGEGSRSQHLTAAAAQVYLIHLLSRCRGVVSPRAFSRALLAERYAPLPDERADVAVADVGVANAADGADAADAAEAAFDCFASSPAEHKAAVAMLNGTAVKNTAKFVASCVNDEKVSQSIRELWLGDYVDE